MSEPYAVNDIYFTIQGEGVHAGRPAIFIRLHGCSVGCWFCDTKQAWHRRAETQVESFPEMHRDKDAWMLLPAEIIAGYALGLLPNAMTRETWQHTSARGTLAVVTGGEPAEQDLAELARALKRLGFYTAIETSGTADGFVVYFPEQITFGHPAIVRKSKPLSLFDWTTVSPKIDMPGGLELNRAACSLADEVKMVIGKPSDFPLLSAYLLEYPPKPSAMICVQPMSQNAKATELCVDAALRRGWRVSVQLHKYIGVD